MRRWIDAVDESPENSPFVQSVEPSSMNIEPGQSATCSPIPLNSSSLIDYNVAGPASFGNTPTHIGHELMLTRYQDKQVYISCLCFESGCVVGYVDGFSVEVEARWE